MSCVFVVVPVVAGAWPMVSAAIVAACAGLGYQALLRAEENFALDCLSSAEEEGMRSVQMTMEDSQVVTDALMRGDSFTFSRGDILATFRIDGRGACSVHVAGKGRSNMELEAAGREVMDRVRQQYAYAKVMSELEERGFQVVDQEVQANRSIRIRVRR